MATDTRNRMISTTARLIQERGLHGVSMRDILAESGAPRGSLYFHFPGGKEALVHEAMRIGIDEATRVLRECLDHAEHPAEGVRAFFRAATDEMVASGYAFGCPVAPIVLDAPGFESELAATCKTAFREWTDMYQGALVDAGMEPDSAATLARMIVASLEGALIMARSERDAACITQVGEEVAALIDARVSRGQESAVPNPARAASRPS